MYLFILVFTLSNLWACDVRTAEPVLTSLQVQAACPDYFHAWSEGEITVLGPFTIEPPAAPEPACVLPPVDNSGSLSTANNYQFLAGRLSWWGITAISPYVWQNLWDEAIRGAADAAGVPARLLKSMIAAESQFWPLWTGHAGEVGWLQVTWAGADTALRHNEQLFEMYCPRAIYPARCKRGYDLLLNWEQEHVQAALLADLRVYGTPLQAAEMAAADLWTSAQVLRGFACWGRVLQPDGDAWRVAAVLYNAGQGCLLSEGFCQAGEAYLIKVLP